ncbi:MAG TPA: hypothetical protein VFJ30_06030 [Phycisphaerae bacterium]|nr:hypothetical protein [Phycisphaerae bacterium]
MKQARSKADGPPPAQPAKPHRGRWIVLLGMTALMVTTATAVAVVMAGEARASRRAVLEMEEMLVMIGQREEAARKQEREMRVGAIRRVLEKAVAQRVTMSEVETWLGPVNRISPATDPQGAAEYTHSLVVGYPTLRFRLAFEDGRLVRFAEPPLPVDEPRRWPPRPPQPARRGPIAALCDRLLRPR